MSTVFENQGLLEVTASRVHCKCINISHTMRDGVVVTVVTTDN